jgi:hypothetical protein
MLYILKTQISVPPLPLFKFAAFQSHLTSEANVEATQLQAETAVYGVFFSDGKPLVGSHLLDGGLDGEIINRRLHKSWSYGN